ncbi:MIP family channel protein [Cellulomonas sp. HZM]|uniref:MIP family channel protein n=1 Tax=Cellulomonas sp. HZM TaxID=1454010 RepID=UPI0004930543|nr:MIP family channel protein [Cellulomonas sp. HZM]
MSQNPDQTPDAPQEDAATTPAPDAPAAPTEQIAPPTEVDAYYVPAGTAIVAGPSLAARLGAEAFGTFFLVLAGLGIALYASLGSLGGGALGVALGFGIAVAASAAAVGHVSGGHFNPAVTIGAAVAGRTPWKDVVPYWVAQLVGGAIGAAVIFIAIPSALPALIDTTGKATSRTFFSGVANGFGAHSPISAASQGQAEFTLVAALIVELVATAVFVGVILGVTDRRANTKVAPFAIGLTLSVVILVAMPVTNASINPARSTAAAIFASAWAWKQLWVFWLAPVVGAALAGLVYRAFAAEPVEDNLLQEEDVYVTDEDVVVVDEHKA